MEIQAIDVFISFLRDHQIDTNRMGSLESTVSASFPKFSESLFRELINCAIKSRNENILNAVDEANALGPWGEIIDTVKHVLAQRQQMAAQNFEKVLELGRKGDKKGVTMTLSKLQTAGHIDYLFKDILRETTDKCRSEGFMDFVTMLEFVSNAIERIESILAAKMAQESKSASSASNNVSTYVLPAPAPATENLAETAPVNSQSGISVSLISPVSSESVVVAQATATIPSNSNLNENIDAESKANDNDNSDDDNDDDVDDDSDDEGESVDEGDADDFDGSEIELIETNEFLTSTIKSCQGDAHDLKLKILTACRDGLISSTALLRVVKDNILASAKAQYTVKLRLLSFIKDFLEEEMNGNSSFSAGLVNDAGMSHSGNDTMAQTAATTTHHAPKFVDANEKLMRELEILFPTSFLDGSQCKAIVCPDVAKSNKKKKIRKAARTMYEEIASKLASHYEQHGWAVCDNFLPLDLVRRVRMEAGLFTSDYEQSEIWVGKQADVGAHLVVPSVRGDKVLWMCGNHLTTSEAPEGVTRNVRTYGEIEPCRLDVKAKAPLRKFSALRQITTAMNHLVESLKCLTPTLSGIYERSDCMMAIYPGNGTRFARHIDNTTEDGRRLTMLVYLNPGWTPEMGGCLRMTPPSSSQAVDILPISGRLALFSSATMPHEVMPTFGDRHSLTIWYYDSTERDEAIKRAREAGNAMEVAKSSIVVQQEAKAFIADLMGGDEIDVSGGDPTAEDLHILAEKVKGLSSDALRIVSNITGAPSEESFRQGFELLTPTDLKSMRQLFRKMGLQ